MDRELSLLMLSLLAAGGFFTLRAHKVFPPFAAFLSFTGWWIGFFVLGNVT